MKKDVSYQEVMETAKRMHETYVSKPRCEGCPMGKSNIAPCRRFAFEHPDEYVKLVMEWGEKHRLGVNEFSNEQERQIDAVTNAAENLIRVMTDKPEYLRKTILKGWDWENFLCYPIHPLEVADIVADRLKNIGVNVFFPTRFDESGKLYADGVKFATVIDEYVRDTYNEPICNE